MDDGLRVPISIVVLTLALFVVSACGGGSSPPPVAASGSTSSTTTHHKVSYPSGGPPDLVFPPGDDAYGLLAKDDCPRSSTLHDTVAGWPIATEESGIGVDPKVAALYRSAGEVCLQQWDAAAGDVDQLERGGATFADNCDQRDVLAWVKAVLQAHADDPARTIEFVRDATRPSTCPKATTTTGAPSTSTTTTTTSTTSTTSRLSTSTTPTKTAR